MILSRYHALRDMTEEGIEVYARSEYREMGEAVVGKAILGEDFVPINPARRDQCR